MEPWAIWFIVAGIFLILEITTLSFYLLWFMMGCVVAGTIALIFPDCLGLQLACGCITTVCLIIFTKPLTAKWRKSKGFLNTSDQLVDRVGEVVEHIADGTTGIVKVDGDTWSAQSDETIKPGEKVTVIERVGLILIVEKYEGGKF